MLYLKACLGPSKLPFCRPHTSVVSKSNENTDNVVSTNIVALSDRYTGNDATANDDENAIVRTRN